MKKYLFIIFILTNLFSCSKNQDIIYPDSSLYFPSLNSKTWETKSVQELNWNQSQVQPLLDFLALKHTKGFIMLYNGRIVIENYFNGQTATKPWYWASAGKTLTTAIVGIAEDNNLLNIDNKVSDYLGNGWTNESLAKENLITCKHLLTMTSGLDDSLGDNVAPSNLQYVADAGKRWAYHNVYSKLQDVVVNVSNQTFVNYFNSNLRDKIGMTGTWIKSGDLNVYWSTARSMARFGLLAYNKGKWENSQIINENYFTNSVNTSQNINDAFGYLWWLNGKVSYHLPQSQVKFQGKLIPNAPDDMYAALGKNDQKIYVVPSKKLVIVRMGEVADGTNFALSTFDNDLWSKINSIIN